LEIHTHARRTFHGRLARFSEPRMSARSFLATIDWGDGSPLSSGRVLGRGKGRFVVLGAHRYLGPGAFPVTITIQDATKGDIAAVSHAIALGKKT
jgi:hypothetical protein